MLKIHTPYQYEQGYVLKQRDLPLVPVFLVVSGRVGVYQYPNGDKTLIKVLDSKDIIGDYERNFIASRAAQYEALTHVKVLKFPKEGYERVTFDKETQQRSEKIKFLRCLPFFKTLSAEHLYRLSKKVKSLKLKYNEALVLKGMKPDCMFISRRGSLRAEVSVSTSETNIWPIHYRLWEVKKVSSDHNFTSVVIPEKRIFGISNILSGDRYS